MQMFGRDVRFLNGNGLKIIAAISMLSDHIGYMIFPGVLLFRIIGRLAFPIFAFMIAEGCFYTKNKLRYFLGIFLLGAICQTVYFIYGGKTDLGILVTFSLSIVTIYCLDFLKDSFFLKESIIKRTFAVLLFLAELTCVWLITKSVVVDYGFWGIMTPVFASVLRTKNRYPEKIRRWDFRYARIFMLGIALLILSADIGGIQIYSLISIPILMLYSGERGRYNMKYFFYIFYPLHLVALEVVAMIIRG